MALIFCIADIAEPRDKTAAKNVNILHFSWWLEQPAGQLLIRQLSRYGVFTIKRADRFEIINVYASLLLYHLGR